MAVFPDIEDVLEEKLGRSIALFKAAIVPRAPVFHFEKSEPMQR